MSLRCHQLTTHGTHTFPSFFDTHADDSADDELGSWLHQLSQNDGTLVVMSVCDDGRQQVK